jgi:hypothetical protein
MDGGANDTPDGAQTGKSSVPGRASGSPRVTRAEITGTDSQRAGELSKLLCGAGYEEHEIRGLESTGD